MTELSIVIVSYNVSDYLRQSLDSVIVASKDIKSEIIVVDNNSDDGSPAMVLKLFPEVRLIVSYTNEGYGAACNKGITAATGEYILILNPDTIVPPATFHTCLEFMKGHPETGALGARMSDASGVFLPESKRSFPSPATSFFRFTGIWRLFKKSALFNRYYLGNMPDDQICKSDILTGAFMFVRRQTLDKSGLFDTTFFMYGEDIDLSWRIVKAGFVNYFLPQVQITHFKSRSASQNETRRIRYFHQAMIIFAAKHFSYSSQLFIIPSIFVKMQFSLIKNHFKKIFSQTI